MCAEGLHLVLFYVEFLFWGDQELDTGSGGSGSQDGYRGGSQDGYRGGEDNSGNSDQVLKPSPSESNQVPGKQLALIGGEGSVKPLFITMSHVLAKSVFCFTAFLCIVNPCQ